MRHQTVRPWFTETPMPAHLRTHLLANYTLHEDGYVRWYKGRTRFICGRKTAPDAVDDRWDELRKAIDGVAVKVVGALLVRDAIGKFFEYLDHRVATGQPEPLSDTTRMDYEKTLVAFGRVVVAGRKLGDWRIGQLGPNEFSAFAKSFAGQSASTLSRHVAYVQAFFRFCKDENLIGELPQWGRYFVKPSKQEHRDARLSQRKSFTPEEIGRLLGASGKPEAAWLWLGINCAFDNSDLAHLTREVVGALGVGSVIDYRRRKRGKVARVCPLLPETIAALKAYERPSPADAKHDDLFFLTPEGLPLARVTRSKSGKPHRIDYVAMQWARLLRRAGIRDKSKIVKVCIKCGLPRPKPWGKCQCGCRTFRKRELSAGQGGDRRGFRSLRTTFPNLSPRGFRDEVEIVMGHATGVLLENYLEEYGVDALRELVESIGHKIRPAISKPQPGEAKVKPKPRDAGKKGPSPRGRRGARKPTP